MCGEEVTPDSDFCPHCGVMYDEAGEVNCTLHPGRGAVGVCIICRTLLCPDCTVEVHGRRFCKEHCLIQVQQDWAELYSSADTSEAELVKSVLEASGFTVQTQNFQNVSLVWSGGGDNPVSRSNIGRPAKVLVPIPEFLDAARALREWESSGGTVHDRQTGQE